MPKTKAQLKLLDQIRQLESENSASIGKISTKDRKLFLDFLNSLKSIVEKTDKQYTLNLDGSYPQMSSEEHRDFLNLYKLAIKQGGICQSKIGKSKANLSQLHILSTIAPLIADDFNALNALDPQNPGSFAEAIQNARTFTIDVTGQELLSAGGVMSSRVPITIKGDGATEIKGFFTREATLSQSQDYKDILQKSINKNTKMVGDAIQSVIKTSYIENLLLFSQNLDEMKSKAKKNSYYNRMWRKSLEEAGVEEQNIVSLISDSKFSDALIEYVEDYHKVTLKYSVFQSAGIDTSQNVEKRNSAMSTVADLLGKGKLLARSKPMKIIENGVAVNGNFMENAEGVDINKMKYGDPILNCDRRSVKASTAFKEIADLQVLDYICGNVDRHGANFFYKLDTTDPKKPQIIGFTGIDNDCSFGTIVKPDMKMVEPKNMRVISESMANSVKSIDENILKTALLNYNFTKEELTAACTRLNILKKEIGLGEKKVVNGDPLTTLKSTYDKILFTIKDDDFGKLKFDDVSLTSKTTNNLFNVLEGSINYLKLDKARLRVEDYEAKANPQMNKEPKKDVFARGTLTSIVENRAFNVNNKKLTTLLKNLDKTDPWFVRSSDEFKQMRTSLKKLCELNAALPQNPSQEDMENLEKCYNDVQQKSDVYLAQKNNSRDSKRARLRSGIAKEINLFVKENSDAFYDAVQKQQANETQNSIKNSNKEQSITVDNKASYLEYIEKQKDNTLLHKAGQEAVVAHTHLCELASKQTLTPVEQLEANENIALMLAYEKLTFTNEHSDDNSTMLDNILKHENALDVMSDKLMQGENFKKLTENATPQFLQEIVKDKGIKTFNNELDNLNISVKTKEQKETKNIKEKEEHKIGKEKLSDFSR